MSVISLYDVLKANKGLPVGEPIACHWGRKLGGGATGSGELTDVPPLTFVANGRNLINYRIYGANDGVGERSIPYGYQINAVVRSENLFDIHKVFNQNTAYYIEDTIYITTGGLWYDILCFTSGASATPVVAKMIHVNAGTYTIKIGKVEKTSGSSVPIGFVAFTQDGSSITNVTTSYVLNESSKTFTLENDGYISLRVSEGRPTIQGLMIVEGSTAPTQYIPYSHTDIPIYIGGTPLAQGEYVDYGEQKVYKYVGGVLTPTDPPVELPALPTIDGTTVADFDNEPKPSEMYIKYPK